MKASRIITVLIYGAALISVKSCDKDVTEEFIGKWETGVSEITVRTQDNSGDYQFTHDSAAAGLEIFSDNTASGFIGTATFDLSIVKKNGGNPSVTGVAFKVECGKIGKIFSDDPLDNKEVEIWLGPVVDNMMESELRYTEGRAHFPMAGLNFHRLD